MLLFDPEIQNGTKVAPYMTLLNTSPPLLDPSNPNLHPLRHEKPILRNSGGKVMPPDRTYGTTSTSTVVLLPHRKHKLTEIVDAPTAPERR
jgi:hypothetical protein